MFLSDGEKRMLDGTLGPLVRRAMEKTLDYARVVGAERLCDVTMAHLFCGYHPYLQVIPETDFDAVYSEMAFCSKERLVFGKLSPSCSCQADVSPYSFDSEWNAGLADPAQASLNEVFLARVADIGVNLLCTCVPYMTGFIPLRGEHYVSSESHAVLMMNSLWAAAGQADGIEAGFWAAVCGKTPYWGLHDPSRRLGTFLVTVEARLETIDDWDLFGHAAGRKIPSLAIPVFVGFGQPDLLRLKSAFASMATTSGTELAHFVGLTPEAPTLEAAFGGQRPSGSVCLTSADLEDSRAFLSAGGRGPVDYVSLGCPHYSVEQIRRVSQFLRGKRISPNTVLHVWTAPAFKEASDRSGYTSIIEAAGGKLLTNSCPLASARLPEGASSVAFDSAKQAHYMKSTVKAKIYYGTQGECLRSSLSGKWEGPH
ncbi:MAG: aconitase X catalytic domain-containing protein [Deltaproteobacteria bacterium]|nr:aconitase X catalytic domain-containing protein [Deltaproteobacteria bacterium]